ncbi:hypothetical protein POM88_009547 [Heracleum sosnowskyi]|uniref:Uncharacterized protein n=1 Tax=Heracleum sosnowskyi TaxID=360622 RepID=A0AAD8J8Y2_9APIA|nr:hypothetical protein POM88_009547 [Heracleum sosnowskyi]
MASMHVQLVMLLLVAATMLVVSDAIRDFAKGPQNWNSGFNFSSGWPWNRPNIPQNYSSPPGFNFTANWPWNSPNIPQNYSSPPILLVVGLGNVQMFVNQEELSLATTRNGILVLTTLSGLSRTDPFISMTL